MELGIALESASGSGLVLGSGLAFRPIESGITIPLPTLDPIGSVGVGVSARFGVSVRVSDDVKVGVSGISSRLAIPPP